MARLKKVVLIAESGSVFGREQLLRELFDDRIELFCAVGIDAAKWADSLQWICTMAEVDEGIEHFIATAWQTDGSFEEMRDMAKQVTIPSGESEIETIRV